MYCKYCGQQIEDGSIYCKYCGNNVSDKTESSANKPGRSFASLAPKYQIAIIIYGVWLLGWIAVLIGNANERHFAEGFLLPFFICTIILPFVCIGGVYIYKLCKKR